jgi:hypothetical protein
MFEQPVNLSTVLYLSVFSRADTLACSVEPNNESYKQSSRQLRTMAADVWLPSRCSPASRTQAKQPIARAVAIGLLEKTERRSYCAVTLPNILTYREALTAAHLKATHDLRLLEVA